jgi:TatD DNase family protein
MLIDTHCHLFAAEFDADRETVIENARINDVSKILLPNIDAASIPALELLHEQHPNYCLPMMGLHPTHVKANFLDELRVIENKMQEPGFIGIGEIGLDYYWDTTFAAEQREAFRVQLRWAKELRLPVAIHTRNSFEDAWRIVLEEKDSDLRGVFHCFTSTAEEARKVLELEGFYFGIGGVVTFKNGGLDKVLPDVPLERMVLETDSPYLAPVPYRGKRNEPAYLAEIAKRLAEVMGTNYAEIARQTTKNAKHLFLLP